MTRTVVETAAVSATDLVPVVGGAFSTVLAAMLSAGYTRRQEDWFISVAEAIEELQTRESFSIEGLSENEQFLDAVVQATRAAGATHESEKLRALTNAVLNTIGSDAPSVDEQSRFLRLIDEFTSGHIQLLALFSNPHDFYSRHGIVEPQVSMGGRATIVEPVPGFEGKADWYKLLANDLLRASLIVEPNFGTTMTGQGIWQAISTPLGDRFMTYVSEPAAIESQPPGAHA